MVMGIGVGLARLGRLGIHLDAKTGLGEEVTHFRLEFAPTFRCH